ncbi:hypothetical protein Lalb_Chr17g0343031 [Lupinus albus]|uniref:Uncharacterized protein n=1 Tax=Lupinus albus TaxID=3870 RepID=A0A6A4P330_LUPAL|nr:hypothetical protein Lalb_Chr17g0343031 [Lupinus albus]
MKINIFLLASEAHLIFGTSLKVTCAYKCEWILYVIPKEMEKGPSFVVAIHVDMSVNDIMYFP